MKRFIAFVAVPAAALASITQLVAFSTNGVSWAVNPVPYYVNPANGDVAAQAAITAIQTAASAWSIQSNASVSLYYMGTTTGTALQNNGKNEVFFRNTSNGNLIGETYWWADANKHLIDADVVLYDGGWKFFTGTSGCSNGVYLEDVMTHELGHALGLNHSTDTTATMYPSIQLCAQDWRTLAPDDQLAIESVYPAVNVPAAPSSLTAQLLSGTPRLTWRDMSSNESGFAVSRSVNGGGWQEIARLAANTAAYTDGSAAAGTTVTYQVAAFNDAGSAASNTAAVTVPTATPPGAPNAPSPANGSTNVSVNADLLWVGVPGATAYDVYFGTAAAPGLYKSTTTASLALPKLVSGVTYYWRIVAKNSAGSTSGLTWAFTTQSTTVRKGNGKG